MTAISINTGFITIELPRHRSPALRRLALRAGIRLLAFSGARPPIREHSEQARVIEIEKALRTTREQWRYGFVQ
jgi:hypothetical protein